MSDLINLSGLGNIWDNVESVSFEPIPAGTYPVVVDKVELRDTKTGGKMVSASLKVIGEQFAGRKLFSGFNIINKNPIAVQIGEKQLKNFVESLGLEKEDLLGKDYADLVGYKVGARIVIKDGRDGEPRNEIKSFELFSESLLDGSINEDGGVDVVVAE